MSETGGKEAQGCPNKASVEGVVCAPLADGGATPGQGGAKAGGDTGDDDTGANNGHLAQNASTTGTRPASSSSCSGKASGDSSGRCVTGEPIDVWTGEVVETLVDLCIAPPIGSPRQTLDPNLEGGGNGQLAFEFIREYSSGDATDQLPFGRGWSHNFDQYIEFADEQLFLRKADGRFLRLGRALLEHPERPQRLLYANLEITRHQDQLRVSELRGSRISTFSLVKREGPARWYLSAIVDRRGNGVDLYYEQLERGPRLQRITDRRGWSVQLDYGDHGCITTARLLRHDVGAATPVELASVRYDYHETGELAQVTDAAGVKTSYVYDGFHRIRRATLPLGAVVHWEYDASSFCKKSFVSGGSYHRELTRKDLNTTVVTGAAVAEEYRFGARGQLLNKATLDGRVSEANTYDSELQITQRVNAAGEAWQWEYDSVGNKTREVDPAGNVTEWSFWPGYAAIRSDSGQFTEAWYDDFSDLVRTRDRGGEERYFDRDQHGRVTAVYAGSSAPNDRGALLERRYYDDHGLLAYREDARGLRTSYVYDGLGYLKQRTDTFGDGRVSRSWLYEHDVYGRLLSQTFPDGSVERFEHTAHGLVTRSVDALGRVTHSTYSTTGQLLSRRHPDGSEWQYRYDLEDRLASISNPRGETHSYRYNLAGQLTEEDTFDGRALRYTYDLAGRVQRIERNDGSYREFTYDPLGNVLKEETSSGALTYERDAHGRVLKATAEDAQATIETHFERDTLGRVICERIGPTDEFEIRWAYDSRGRVKTRTALGERTEYEYDIAGDLCAVVHHPKGGTPVRTQVQRNLDGLETRRLAETLLPSPDAYRQGNPAPLAIDSEYDAQGHLTSRRAVVPDGAGQAPDRAARYHLPPNPSGGWKSASERRYSYDAAGRVTHCDDVLWGRQRFQYDAADRLDTAERERLVEHFDYDAAGSVDAALRTFDGQPLWGQLPAPAAHDAANAQLPIAPQAAPPPPWFKALGSPAVAYSDRGNQLIRHGYYDYENDALGRLVARRNRQTGETTHFEWDVWDQLREVRRPDGYRVQFDYDAWGRRVRKRVLPPAPKPEQLIPVLAKLFAGEELDADEAPAQLPEYEVAYLWDEDELCGELHGSGWQRVHVHVPGHPVVGREHEPSYVPFLQSQDGQVYQVIVDQLGTPKELLRVDGSILWSAAHSAWGETLEVWRATVEAKAPLESPFRLQGQYWDHETGLSCTRYRYFDNSLGRWLSPDPLGTGGGYNLLGFNGSPTLVSDPLGLKVDGHHSHSGDPSVESPGTRKKGEEHAHAEAGEQNHPPGHLEKRADRAEPSEQLQAKMSTARQKAEKAQELQKSHKGKTVAVNGGEHISGYKTTDAPNPPRKEKGMKNGDRFTDGEGRDPVKARDYDKEIGHDTYSNSSVDPKVSRGADGEVNRVTGSQGNGSETLPGGAAATHAERQSLLEQNKRGTNDPVGISTEQCGDCRAQHQKHAQNPDRPYPNDPVVVADPQHTRVYHNDGSVDVFDKNGNYVGTAPPGTPPEATINKYKGMPW
ncbi:MAG: RHS repeat-associated core domain-containing protein [Polyangiaceae bacterium]